MAEPSAKAGPPIDDLSSVFHVTEVRREEDRLLYFGDPIAPREVVMRTVWPAFHERGYEVTLSRRSKQHVLVAEPIDVGINGIPWTNVFLFVATLGTTLLWAGPRWYLLPPTAPIEQPLATLMTVWPFAGAVLGVLAVHEAGHYILSRHHRVEASLPYFIPIPNVIGTMGAVIRMKGTMPSRKALFDIGVAGPLAGLVATVIVAAIGLHLEPLPAQVAALQEPTGPGLQFQDPPLLRVVAEATGTVDKLQRGLVHPVYFGAWVGAFVTFLNLLPVGQLDGGHIMRALIGKRQPTVAALIPGAVFGWAGYLYYVEDLPFAATMWGVLGLLTLVAAIVGPATPVEDGGLGRNRTLLGLGTFVLGALCFMPVPIRIIF